MQLVITVAQGKVELRPGESLDANLTWKNADGTERSMSGATVQAKVYEDGPVAGERKLLATVAVSDPATLSVPAATTALWPSGKRLRVEVWETRGLKALAGWFTLAVA